MAKTCCCRITICDWTYYIKDHQQMSLFCNISLLYVSTLHVSGLYRPIIRGIPSCCLLLPLGSCGAWRLSACVWVLRCWLGEQYRSLSLCGFLHSPVTFYHLGPNTIQPMTYRILSQRQMSPNFKNNWNYNNFLHLAVSVYILMLTCKSYCLIATCFPHVLSGVTHYHL
jgi:hypothetical protein